MNLDNLQLYAVILLAVLLIIALGVIYLHNKKINGLTQQLKKNTFEITALQSVLEGHMEQLISGAGGHIGSGINSHGHIHPDNLSDISMTTTPKQVSQEEYYGDYDSHVDGQQYTDNVREPVDNTDNQEGEDSVDEDELTDYDSDDEQITIDDVLSSVIEQEDIQENLDHDDIASVVDNDDIQVDDIEISIDDEANIGVTTEEDQDISSEVIDNTISESIAEEISVVDEAEAVVESVVETEAEAEAEAEAEEEDDKKEKGHRKKKSPTISAKEYDVGAVILSDNDGQYYTVYQNSRGSKRWKKVKDEDQQ